MRRFRPENSHDSLGVRAHHVAEEFYFLVMCMSCGATSAQEPCSGQDWSLGEEVSFGDVSKTETGEGMGNGSFIEQDLLDDVVITDIQICLEDQYDQLYPSTEESAVIARLGKRPGPSFLHSSFEVPRASFCILRADPSG